MIITQKELPKRREFDHYPTPDWLAERAMDLITVPPKSILDVGAGGGIWGEAARRQWPEAWIEGIELRSVQTHWAYDSWLTQDYLSPVSLPPCPTDLVIGNPPYALAEPFLRRSFELLNRGGEVMFLLRLAFLAGQKRRASLFAEHPPKVVAVSSKRPGFNVDNNRTNATDFAVLLWERGWKGQTSLTWL